MDEHQPDPQSVQENDYIRLERLLKKKRNQEQNQVIEGILNSSSSVAEKIEKITSYDRTFQEYPARTENLANKPMSQGSSLKSEQDGPIPPDMDLELSETIDKTRIAYLIRQHHITTAKAAFRNQESIKKKFFRMPYLFFLFGEFRKIKKFARDTRTVVARFLPPRVRVDANLQNSLLYIIRKDAQDLQPYLDKLLALAWQVLEKDQYNLIAKFQDLVIMLANARFSSWDLNSTHVLENMVSIERLFLIFYLKPEYPEMVMNGIDMMLKKSSFDAEVVEKLNVVVKRILLPEEARPSFYYFILAGNMVKYRRYLVMQDLINPSTNEVINNFHYDCSQKVKVQISQYIKQKSEMLQHFSREKYEIEKVYHFLGKYLKDEEDGGYDFRILSAFYSVLSRREQYNLSNDQDRLEKLIPRFINGYLENFEQFLTGPMKIEGYGTVQVFHPDFASYEVSRIHSFLEKLYKELFNCPQMSHIRYISLLKKRDGKGASAGELALVTIIEEISEIIVETGKKLTGILVNYRHPETEPEEIRFSPLESSTIMLQNIYIPFWNGRLISDQLIGSKSFREAILYIIHISLVFGLFMQNQNLNRLMERKAHVQQEFSDLDRMLKRVADVITYDKIQNSLMQFPF